MTQLSSLKISKAQPKTKSYTLADGEGLYLQVEPNGSKLWRFRFYWQGVASKISFGVYPSVDLKTARILRNDAKALLARGIDPREERKQAKRPQPVSPEESRLFDDFAQEWMTFKIRKLGGDARPQGSKSTIKQLQRYLHKDFLPVLGGKPMHEITRADLIQIIRNIEGRGSLAIAHKCRGWLEELFRYALGMGMVESNLATDLAIVSLPKPAAKNNPYLKMDELPTFLADLSHYPGYTQTSLGIRLLMLTGVRTGELRHAEPHHFDLDNAIWRVPPDLVKQLQKKLRKSNEVIPPYLVPLSRQAVEVVKKLLSLRYPWQKYLLCNLYDPQKIISENTLNFGIQRMGYKDRLTGHGIRATISTALNELDYPKQWVEAQLSHADPNKIAGTYNHAEYVEQRRKMMQEWADRLDRWQVEGLAQKDLMAA